MNFFVIFLIFTLCSFAFDDESSSVVVSAPSHSSSQTEDSQDNKAIPNVNGEMSVEIPPEEKDIEDVVECETVNVNDDTEDQKTPKRKITPLSVLSGTACFLMGGILTGACIYGSYYYITDSKAKVAVVESMPNYTYYSQYFGGRNPCQVCDPFCHTDQVCFSLMKLHQNASEGTFGGGVLAAVSYFTFFGTLFATWGIATKCGGSC